MGSPPNFAFNIMRVQLFHDAGPYHIETSQYICPANQWSGFYIIQIPYERVKRFMIISGRIEKVNMLMIYLLLDANLVTVP